MQKETIDKFFQEQLSEWQECSARYADLGKARRKDVVIDGREYHLMFNPARMRSATAKVVAGKVDRPCFLCRDNRPALQRDIEIRPEGSSHTYLLALNPFPILPKHFTVINNSHERQTMTSGRLSDMEHIARELEGYLVFFNGACSGASAPDHFHFQAVPREFVPLTTWEQNMWRQLGVQHGKAENVKIDFDRSDFCNILCWADGDHIHWWVIDRRRHRPWQYDAHGEEHVLISPAALEFAGVVPLARGEDFKQMTPSLLNDLLCQCWNREPLVDVGIGPERFEVISNTDGTTILKDVRIGIGFHWDQRRDFRYEGKIIHKKDLQSGSEWTVNRLSAERYLKSVISSEMSATSSLQLLKAHAVISRSWLMFGSAPHTLFDVCSDDCCQRYQGISSKMNPVVEQAIEETRGETLMFDGEICDARYSKCCGGLTEEFRYCWENRDYPYLRSIRDTRKDGSIFCDTSNKKVLSQVLNDYDQRTHDFFNWTVEYTQQQLSDLIERKLQAGIGVVLDLIAEERGMSGRISKLRIIGEKGETTIGKELVIRKTLSETCLYSSNFEVEQTPCNPNTSPAQQSEITFRLKGRGWGHGVGLCQIGAAVMGEEGYDYREILAHYYPGAEIKKLW